MTATSNTSFVGIGEPYNGVQFQPAALDAFGRQRVSGTGQRLDVEFLYDKQINYFDEITTNGTVTHNADTRDLTLALTDAANGSSAQMASFPVPYTPGNSQLIDITGVLDLAALGGGTAEVFLRSSVTGAVTENVVPQSSWVALSTSADVDWATSHIFAIDFQSLKVGRVRYGLVQNGVFCGVTEINNDNLTDSGYWQIPNLPLYWRLYTAGGFTYAECGYGDSANGVGFRYKIPANANATMKAICGTVKSEGGLDLENIQGVARAINNGVTPVTVSTTRRPVLSIRPKATFQSLANLILAIPRLWGMQITEAVRIDIILGGTLTGASWADVDTANSAVEFDVAATVITGGIVVYSEYRYATTSGPAAARNVSVGPGLLGKAALWNRLGAETGSLTVAAVRTGGTDAVCLASLQWDEVR